MGVYRFRRLLARARVVGGRDRRPEGRGEHAGAALQHQAVEEELRSSETRYRVIEQATDGIYILDAETRRRGDQSFLPEDARLYSERTARHARLRLRRAPTRERRRHHRADARAAAPPRRREEARRKDGILLDVEVGVSVISLDGRNMICTIVRDVTERKQAEEDLKQSEKLYRTVIEQATENICLVDVETRRIVESNTAFQTALGYTEAELRT